MLVLGKIICIKPMLHIGRKCNTTEGGGGGGGRERESERIGANTKCLIAFLRVLNIFQIYVGVEPYQLSINLGLAPV